MVNRSAAPDYVASKPVRVSASSNRKTVFWKGVGLGKQIENATTSSRKKTPKLFARRRAAALRAATPTCNSGLSSFNPASPVGSCKLGQ